MISRLAALQAVVIAPRPRIDTSIPMERVQSWLEMSLNEI